MATDGELEAAAVWAENQMILRRGGLPSALRGAAAAAFGSDSLTRRARQLLPKRLPRPSAPPAPGHDEGPVTCIAAGHEPFSTRRMGDSNPRGLSPNTLSKRAP